MSEKKDKTSAKARVEEFMLDLTLKNDKLHCPWCNIDLDPTRKSSIESHIKSKIHQKNKASGQSESITNFAIIKCDALKDFLIMMLSAEIPLYKVSYIHTFFIQRNIPGLKMPSISTLRTTLIPNLYKEVIDFIKNNYF